MFIYTARLKPKRIFFCLAALMMVFGTVMGFSQYLGSSQNVGFFSDSTKLKDESSQREFLTELGYTLSTDSPLVEDLQIPETFDSSYNSYLALQESQGFSLLDYAGKTITRYTYILPDFSGADDAMASLLLYKNKLISGEIYESDGNMLPLIPQDDWESES